METYIVRFIVMVLLVCLPSFGSAKTWYVHQNSTLSKTQVALNVCGNSDAVLVNPGIYYDNVIYLRIPRGRIKAAKNQDLVNSESSQHIV